LVVREISVAEAAPVDAIADRDAVLMALRNMPALHRAALVLRYVDGLSLREVARELGRSESATDSLIRRAKERFKATYPEAVDG
jgi:RNA polymerase sigma-70 factor (ECF subfamily)